MYTAYSKRRMPKGLISVTTDNLESMKSFFKSMDEKLERDPHYIPKIGIESNTGKGGAPGIKHVLLECFQLLLVFYVYRARDAAGCGDPHQVHAQGSVAALHTGFTEMTVVEHHD